MNNYLLYLLVSVGYISSPGPAVFVAINGGATVGVKRTIALLAGNTVGLGLLSLISALGIGVFILNSVELTAIVKTLGAFWLVYLGIKMMRAQDLSELVVAENRLEKIYSTANWFYKFRDGLVLALTNPKPVIFFVSIYPQFIVVNGFEMQQFLLMGLTFMLLSFGILNFYSLLSRVVAEKFLSAKKINLLNYIFGSLFLLLALFLLTETWRLYFDKS